MNRAQINVLLGASSGVLGGMALSEFLRDRLLRIIAGASDVTIIIIIAAIGWWKYKHGEKEPVT
jgi:hypothetical protein